MTVGYTHTIEIDGNELNCFIDPPNRPFRRRLLYHPSRRVQSTVMPSERDLGPFDVFVQQSWHLGEGQDWLRMDDPENVSPYRYRASEGVNIDKDYENTNLYKTLREKATDISISGVAYYDTLSIAIAKIWMAGNDSNAYDVAYSADGDTWTNQATGFTTGNVDCMDGTYDKLYVGGLVTANYHIRSVTVGGNASVKDLGTGSGNQPTSILCHNDLVYYTAGDTTGSTFNEMTTAGVVNYTYPPSGTVPEYFFGLTAEIGGHVFCLSAFGPDGILWEYDGTELGVAWKLPRGYIPRSCHAYNGLIFIGASYQVGTATYDGVIFWYEPNTTSWGVLLEIESGTGYDNGPKVIDGFGKDLFFGWDEYQGIGRYAIDTGGYSKYLRTTATPDTTTKVTGIAKFGAYRLLMCSGNVAASEGTWREDFNNKETGEIELSTIDLNCTHKKLWYQAGTVIGPAASAGDSVTLYYSGDEGENYIEIIEFPAIIVYPANTLPESAKAPWELWGDAATYEIDPYGTWHVESSSSKSGYIRRLEPTFDNTAGTTLEWEMQVRTDSAYGIELWIYDGTQAEVFIFYDDRVWAWNANEIHYMDTTDDFHTYRMTQKGTTVKLYVDGNDTPKFTGTVGNPSTLQYIMLEFDYSGGDKTHYDVRYLSYTTGEYIPSALDMSEDVDLTEYQFDYLNPDVTIKAKLKGNVRVRKIWVKGLVVPTEALLWDFYIGAAEKVRKMDGYDVSESAEDIRSLLKSAAATRHIVTFKDIDGETYQAVVLDYQDNILTTNPDTGTQESLIKVRLMQVIPSG
jgi:hypothetical protein